MKNPLAEQYFQSLKESKYRGGICWLCPNHVKLLIDHHISYNPEIKKPVCKACHWKAHFQPWLLTNTQLYKLLAPVVSFGELEARKGNLLKFYSGRLKLISSAENIRKKRMFELRDRHKKLNKNPYPLRVPNMRKF